MRVSDKNDVLNIDTNLITSITSFIVNLDLIIKEFQDKFDKVYNLYLNNVDERNKTAKGSTLAVRMPTKPFEKVSRIYDRVSKTLNDFSKVFLHDFSDIVEIMLELNTLKQKHQMLSIELSLDKDFLDEGQVYRKENKISKVKSDYDKLVSEFEIRNKELTALKNNLSRQVLIYHSLKTGRKFLLNLKGELAEFQYLVELDSKKYSDMIVEYSQLFDDQLKKLTLTPINQLNKSFAPSKAKPRLGDLASQKTFTGLNSEESAAKYRKVVEEVNPPKAEPPRLFAEQSLNFKSQFKREVKKERKEPKKMKTDATASTSEARSSGLTLGKMMETGGFNFKLPTVAKEPKKMDIYATASTSEARSSDPKLGTMEIESQAIRRRSEEESDRQRKLLRIADDVPSLILTVIENLVRINQDSESNHVKLVNLALILPSKINHTEEELKVIARELVALRKNKKLKNKNIFHESLFEKHQDLKCYLSLLRYWKNEIQIKLDSSDQLTVLTDYEFSPLEDIPLMTLEAIGPLIKNHYDRMVRNLTIYNNAVLNSQLFKKFESNHPELLMVKDNFRIFAEQYKNWKRQIVNPDIDLSTEKLPDLPLQYLRHEVVASIINVNYLYFLRDDFCFKYEQSSNHSGKRFYALMTAVINKCIEMAWDVNGNILLIIKKLNKLGFNVSYEDMMAPMAPEISSDFTNLSNNCYDIFEITMKEDKHILWENAKEPTIEQIQKLKAMKSRLMEDRNRLENEYHQLVEEQRSLIR